MTDTCASCRYFIAVTSPAFPSMDGMCRRYAPQGPTIGTASSNGFQVFPPMLAAHWCGDHAVAPAAARPAQARRA